MATSPSLRPCLRRAGTAAFTLALLACKPAPPPVDAPVAPAQALSPDELAAAPPGASAVESWDPPPAALDASGVPTAAGTPYAPQMAQVAAATAARAANRRRATSGDPQATQITVVSEFDNYRDGKVAVPAYPGDVLYLNLEVHDGTGAPLKRTPVEIRSARKLPVVLSSPLTDDEGTLQFHLVAGPPGDDTVTVTAAGAASDFYVDVTEPPRGEWLTGLDLAGVTSWDLLLSAQVDVGFSHVSAAFPPPLLALRRRRLRLAGFMMPLGVEEKQKHFLLSANPPSCFFHPPGGPASVVEVFADKGIAMSYDPLVIEGEFELVDQSDGGILYRLRSTRLIATGS